MAISSKEYQNIIPAIQNLSKLGVIFNEEEVHELDEIRLLNKKYRTELIDLYWHRRHKIDKARIIAKDIIEFCRNLNISTTFYKPKKPDYQPPEHAIDLVVERYIFDKGIYVWYSKDDIDLTHIINLK